MTSTRSLVVGLIVLGAVCISAALASRQDNLVRGMQLPLDFPVVGNVDGVKQWRFGRLESVDRLPNSGDIGLIIRVMDGSTVNIVGPPDPLIDLAFQSSWVAGQNKVLPTRPDYVERMIAFDADASGRLIALMSLEPLNRNRNRMYRAFGR